MSSQTSSLNASGDASSSLRLLQALSEGMHAVVQPLAIAQANLELVLFRGKTLEEYKQATEESLSHMFRGMELLTYVHELIRIHRAPDSVAPLSLAAPLEAALEDLDQLFAEKQVQLSASLPDTALMVLGSPEPMRQVFFYVLQAAQAMANAGDAVSVRVTRLPERQMVEAAIDISTHADATAVPDQGLVVTNGAASARKATQAIDPQVARSLTLAEAIITRQHGEFHAVLAPLAVRLCFPADDGGKENRIVS
jgi:signal transduction histidine kinase